MSERAPREINWKVAPTVEAWLTTGDVPTGALDDVMNLINAERDDELRVIVSHIQACANAAAPMPHAEGTARSLHMLALALGDHKAHRKINPREGIVTAAVDIVRKVGHGAGDA